MVLIFIKIINGEIFCYKVVEDKDFIVFLDINFNVKGYILCVFKKEINKIFDMEESYY